MAPKSKPKRPMPRKFVDTEASGRLLAASMLDQMEKYETAPGEVHSLWPWSIEAKYRPVDTQQDNVLLRFLDSLQGKRRALAGFCMVVTDHLGQAGNVEQTRFLSTYVGLSKRDLTGKPGPWPKMG